MGLPELMILTFVCFVGRVGSSFPPPKNYAIIQSDIIEGYTTNTTVSCKFGKRQVCVTLVYVLVLLEMKLIFCR